MQICKESPAGVHFHFGIKLFLTASTKYQSENNLQCLHFQAGFMILYFSQSLLQNDFSAAIRQEDGCPKESLRF